VRTHALRSFWPISNAAHRSCNSSIEIPPDTNELNQSAPVRRSHRDLKNLIRVLSATIDNLLSVAPNPMLTDELTASRKFTGVPDERGPIFRLHGGPSEAGPGMLTGKGKASGYNMPGMSGMAIERRRQKLPAGRRPPATSANPPLT